MYEAHSSCLNQNGFPFSFLKSYLISITCDGVAVLIGKKNDVTKILLDNFPNLIIWHCAIYRFELSVKDA
jgi:hypothetical protein